MKTRWLLGCALLCAVVGVAAADKAKPTKSDKKSDHKSDKAVEAAPAPEATGSAAPGEAEAEPGSLESLPHITGPKQVDLGHHLVIDLPDGMTLFERKEAVELLSKGGNDTRDTVAVVFPRDSSWWASIDASDQGYVSDSDADDLDADALRKEIKEGTDEQNKERVKLGVAELFVDDWSEKPHYNMLSHHLVWSLNAHSTNGKSVNYSTRVLGRNGIASLDVIDSPDNMAKAKTESAALLNGLHFTAGFRYQDHVSGDHDSGVGLKALVVGGTAVVLAKKGGILIAILLALKKAFIVVVIAIGAFFKRLFGGGKKRDAALAASLPDSSAGAPPDQGPPSPPDGQGSA